MQSLIKLQKKSIISFLLSLTLHLVVIFFISKLMNNKEAKVDNKFSSSELIELGEFQLISRPKSNSIDTQNRNVSAPESPRPSLTVKDSSLNIAMAGNMDSSEVYANVNSVKQKYFLELKNLVESKKNYPFLARQREIQGIVIVSVIIKKNGEVTDHQIVQTSGHDILDQAALNLAKKINIFKSIPDELGNDNIELKIPIAYRLAN